MTRAMGWKLLALAAILTGLGCGGGSDEAEHGHLICDGSDEPRLLYQFSYEPVLFPGLDLLHENGYGFLVVDGKCRSWLKRRPVDPVRTGVLDELAADRLAKILRVAEWESLAGSYCTVQVDPNGKKELHARLGDVEIVVNRDCEETDLERVRTVDWILQTTPSSIAQLWNGFTDAEGPVRLMVVRDLHPELSKDFDESASWPLSTPAWQLSVEWEHAHDFRKETKSLIAEGDDADKLRDLRARWLRGEFSMTHGFIPTEEDGRYYRLYVRDTITLEDENGLWTVR